MEVTQRGVTRFPGDHHGGVSRRLIEADVELFARLAVLKGCLQQFAEEELQAGGIQPSMRTALFHRDRHSATLGFGPELTPHRTGDGTNRHILTSDDGKHGCHIVQPDGDHLFERFCVTRRYGSEARISSRFERYAVVIHQGQHALDRAERIPEIVPKMAEAIAQCLGVGLHVSPRRGE